MLKTKRSSNKKIILIVSSAIILLLALGLFILYTTHSLFFTPSNQTNPAKTNDTSQEETSNQQKQNNIDASTPKDESETTVSKNLIITESDVNDGIVSVRAYLSEISENGGTCAVTFSKVGQTSVITTSSAFGDASTTQCGANDTPTSKFGTTGIWNVKITYSSSTTTAEATGTVTL